MPAADWVGQTFHHWQWAMLTALPVWLWHAKANLSFPWRETALLALAGIAISMFTVHLLFDIHPSFFLHAPGQHHETLARDPCFAGAWIACLGIMAGARIHLAWAILPLPLALAAALAFEGAFPVSTMAAAALVGAITAAFLLGMRPRARRFLFGIERLFEHWSAFACSFAFLALLDINQNLALFHDFLTFMFGVRP